MRKVKKFVYVGGKKYSYINNVKIKHKERKKKNEHTGVLQNSERNR